MNWLYDLEIYQIIFTLAGGGLLVTAVIPALIRWKFKLEPSEAFGKGADDAFKLIISITLLLTAFSLVRVQGDHRNAEDLVAREAALVFKLNRALHGYGGQEAAELRVDLLAYAKAIVDDEWPLLETQQRSEVASILLADMTKGIRMLDPKNMVQQIARVVRHSGSAHGHHPVGAAQLFAQQLALCHRGAHRHVVGTNAAVENGGRRQRGHHGHIHFDDAAHQLGKHLQRRQQGHRRAH